MLWSTLKPGYLPMQVRGPKNEEKKENALWEQFFFFLHQIALLFDEIE